MSNPFKQLNFDDQDDGHRAPESIKTKVLGTYNFIASTIKILELFIGNVSNSVVGLVKLYDNNKQKTPPAKDDNIEK